MSLQKPVPGFKNFKRIDPQNLCQFYTGDDTQLVLKISRKDEVKRIVEKFKTEMVAFHCRSDGRQLLPVDPNSKITVHEIPKHMNDVQTVYDWVVDNCPPITTDRMGTIAAKNSTLIKNNLTEYDLGLTKTKAGIVYRDKYLNATNEAIINAHRISVENSDLESSSSYIKRARRKNNV